MASIFSFSHITKQEAIEHLQAAGIHNIEEGRSDNTLVGTGHTSLMTPGLSKI